MMGSDDYVICMNTRLAIAHEAAHYLDNLVTQLRSELAAANTRADGAERDAARYRWLRIHSEKNATLKFPVNGKGEPIAECNVFIGVNATAIDKSIDEVMKNG